MSLTTALPPCAGMLRMPLTALLVRAVRPCEARADHALASPMRGALSLPARWHALQTASTTSLPCRSFRWACAGAAKTESAVNRANADNAAPPGRNRTGVDIAGLLGGGRTLPRRFACKDPPLFTLAPSALPHLPQRPR